MTVTVLKRDILPVFVSSPVPGTRKPVMIRTLESDHGSIKEKLIRRGRGLQAGIVTEPQGKD